MPTAPGVCFHLIDGDADDGAGARALGRRIACRGRILGIINLIYRTSRGELVRSKSELLIAEKLFSLGMNYRYERVLEGTVRPGRLRPDFSFVDDAGGLILWEHLGRMDREGWEWKRQWYAQNNYAEGRNLFTSTEEQIRDVGFIDKMAKTIQAELE